MCATLCVFRSTDIYRTRFAFISHAITDLYTLRRIPRHC